MPLGNTRLPRLRDVYDMIEKDPIFAVQYQLQSAIDLRLESLDGDPRTLTSSVSNLLGPCRGYVCGNNINNINKTQNMNIGFNPRTKSVPLICLQERNSTRQSSRPNGSTAQIGSPSSSNLSDYTTLSTRHRNNTAPSSTRRSKNYRILHTAPSQSASETIRRSPYSSERDTLSRTSSRASLYQGEVLRKRIKDERDVNRPLPLSYNNFMITRTVSRETCS